jgi:hypothetical protein
MPQNLKQKNLFIRYVKCCSRVRLWGITTQKSINRLDASIRLSETPIWFFQYMTPNLLSACNRWGGVDPDMHSLSRKLILS